MVRFRHPKNYSKEDVDHQLLFHDLGHWGLIVLNQGIYLSLTYTKEDTHHCETFKKYCGHNRWTLFCPKKLNPVNTSC